MLPDAHVRLAHPDSNGGARILRRGYSFTDGTDGLGPAGRGAVLPRLPARRAQGLRPAPAAAWRADDALNEYIQHVGSAVFAVPPGVRDEDDWWGRALFS